MKSKRADHPKGVILNAYPDSLGGKLGTLVTLVAQSDLEDAFSMVYILPTFFHSDLDRGFSIIDYDLNEELVQNSDLQSLREKGIDLKLDIVLNHLSVSSPQFQDLLEYGENSQFKDFFINWNHFWTGNGQPGPDGVIIPDQEYLDKLFTRKPELPVLKVPFPDGSEQPYWNTFYQETRIESSNGQEVKRTLLGQMDVNAQSEAVWVFYDETLSKLRDYGCKIVRLDAFAYLHKEVGSSNFFNRPGTWNYLERIRKMAETKGLSLLPEIHAEYGSGLHEEVASKGFLIYDFFLPGLILHTLETGSKKALLKWAREIQEKGYKTINMLGCHDGIPLLDLKGKEVNGAYKEGLLEDEEIENLLDTILRRGGRIKNLYDPNGRKISYYQVNATYFSALGEDPRKLLLARAIQLFMPGTPQIWYLDLFAGKNDYAAADKLGKAGHKEINRTNLTLAEIELTQSNKIVKDQLTLLRVRNSVEAFDGVLTIHSTDESLLDVEWRYGNDKARLRADLNALNFEVDYWINRKRHHLTFS